MHRVRYPDKTVSKLPQKRINGGIVNIARENIVGKKTTNMSLLEAVAAGDMGQVKKLLASGVDINTVYRTFYTALAGAVYYNNCSWY